MFKVNNWTWDRFAKFWNVHVQIVYVLLCIGTPRALLFQGGGDCNTPVLTPFALKVIWCNIVINRGVELKPHQRAGDKQFHSSSFHDSILPFVLPILTQRRSLFILTHRILLCFTHAVRWKSGLRALFMLCVCMSGLGITDAGSFMIFRWITHSRSVCICVPYRFCGFRGCMFSSPTWGCVFLATSLLRPGLLFSPHYSFVMGYYWVILATIGPRMTQGSYFPSQVVSCLFCCIYAVVGLRTVLEWSEGLVCLIKLVSLGAT